MTHKHFILAGFVIDLPGMKQRCVVFAITIVTLRVIYKKVHFDESFSTLHGKFYI